MLYLKIVQHREGFDPPSLLKAVKWSARGVLLGLELLLLPPLLLLAAPLRWLLLLLAADVVDEALSPPTHPVQHGEASLGAAHPEDGTVLHDRPHLSL